MRIVNKKGLTITVALSSIVLLTGCQSKIDKIAEQELNQNDEEIEDSQEMTNEDEVNYAEPTEDDRDYKFQMSEDQKEALEKAESQTSEEAVDYNQSALKVGIEIKKDVPKAKSEFTDMKEAGQFISYLFFKYHTNLINGEKFYTDLKPYMHKEFESLLPALEENRLDMFVTLQNLFIEQLPAPIENYQMTEVVFGEDDKTAWFYRKYQLKNGNDIFYMTTLKKVKSAWYLVEDAPMPGYITKPNDTFKDTFITNKENKEN